MALRSALQKLAPAALAAVLLAACDSDPLPPPKPLDAVFVDDFGEGVSFQAFSPNDGCATEADGATVSVDTSVRHAGTASLKITIPAVKWYGGAFPTDTPRDLSGFDALELWIRASKAVTLNVAGLGNDNTGTSLYPLERKAIPVTTEWTRVVIPVPDPSKLANEAGLFHFAEGSDEGAYTLWIDEMRYVKLPEGELGTPVPSIATETLRLDIGASAGVNGATVEYPGGILLTPVSRNYFTWASSNEAAATVDASGTVHGVAAGTAEITAKLGAIDANGVTTVEVAAPTVPVAGAPAPAHAAADVIALFSDAYTPVTVDRWSTDWDNTAEPVDVDLDGNAAKKYASLVFAGIEFTSATIDASAMTHFHLDVWSPDATELKVKLVDFGADGAWSGGDDTEHELTFTPANGEWVSLDIPLADFTGLTARAHLAQLIFVSSNATVFFDNVYFHK